MVKSPYSFTINGEYLENIIDGYQTKAVRGRELYELDNDIIENVYDGASIKNSRRPYRILEIDYILVGVSYSDIRIKLNELNRVINKKNMMIIFDDEDDKYLVANYNQHNEELKGNAVDGTIEFICEDPNKYSIDTKTFEAVPNSEGVYEATIVNNGTVEVPINYIIQNNHDNGFIGIVSANGAMQYGYIDEVDNVVNEFSEYSINQTATQLNTNLISATSDMFIGSPNLNGSKGVVTENSKTYIKQISGGTDANKWHGYGGYLQLSNATELNNFKLMANLYILLNDAKKSGRIQIHVLGTNNEKICGIDIYNGNSTNITNNICMYVGGKKVKTITFKGDAKTYFKSPSGQIYIQKEGDNFTFGFGTKKYTFSDDVTTQIPHNKVSIGFFQMKGKTYSTLGKYYLYSLKLREDKEELVDIPNRYPNGSIVEIDGNEGKIYVDGTLTQEDEVLGTTYFKAPQGDSLIQIVFSDWIPIDEMPNVSISIREAWL